MVHRCVHSDQLGWESEVENRSRVKVECASQARTRELCDAPRRALITHGSRTLSTSIVRKSLVLLGKPRAQRGLWCAEDVGFFKRNIALTHGVVGLELRARQI